VEGPPGGVPPGTLVGGTLVGGTLVGGTLVGGTLVGGTLFDGGNEMLSVQQLLRVVPSRVPVDVPSDAMLDAPAMDEAASMDTGTAGCAVTRTTRTAADTTAPPMRRCRGLIIGLLAVCTFKEDPPPT